MTHRYLKMIPSGVCFLAFLLMGSLLQGQEDADLRALFRGAQSDIEAEQYEDAIEKLQKYTDARNDNSQAWFFLGYALHMDGQLDKAIKAHKKATKDPQLGTTALYNLGCAYSLKNETETSLEYLHQALDNGFPQLDLFETDNDLKNVRKVDGYKEIEARLANGGQRMEQEKTTTSEAKPTKKLIGKWRVTSGERAGEKVDASRLPPEITFTKKDVTIPAGEDKFVMSYNVVGESEGVVHLDFKIESGPAPEGTALAILKLDENGSAKLCYDPMGQNRPENFETTTENGFFLFDMEKTSAPEAKGLAEDVVGKWKIVSGVRAGEEVTEERLAAIITFDSDEITIPAGEDKFVMSYEINTDASPAQIDMKIESGPAPEGSPAKGILKMTDGKFILCYDAEGLERPAKFKSTAENGFFYFEMKKVKD